MYIHFHAKNPLFLLDFDENWTFCTDFRKILKNINVVKISSVEVELFLVDGQKDEQNGQADGRIDNHNKTVSHSSQFGESA